MRGGLFERVGFPIALPNINFHHYKFTFMGSNEAESDVLGPEAKREGRSREQEAESDISAGEKWISFKFSAPGIRMNADKIERVF